MDVREKRSRKAIRAALATIDAATQGRPLALALSEALRAGDKLGPQERRAAANAARAAVRELRRIDAALGIAGESLQRPWRKVEGRDKALLRYLALRVSVEGEDPSRALGELALPGPLRPRSIDDAALALWARALPAVEALPVPSEPASALAHRRSVPDFLARRFVAELGPERADAVLAALNLPPRLDLRANRLLVGRDELARRLEKEGVSTEPGRLAPDCLIAVDRASLFGRAHSEGLFEVQDEGSQLIALACAARPGEVAIDFCAGSGGKALALAAQIGAKGRVVACDRVARRLDELPARARRARAQKSVQAQGPEPSEELLGRADVVLVDAPCSGLGGMRREVDLRWRLKESELALYPARQLEILESASRFVRPGGRLVYATCSPFKAEGEEVARRFLESHPSYALDEAAPIPEAARVGRGQMRVWPDLHGGGAFFAAAMRRGADSHSCSGPGVPR